MAEPDVQRELGGIAQSLSNINQNLTQIVTQMAVTNGRVSKHDAEIAVLKDRDGRVDDVKEQLLGEIGRVDKKVDETNDRVDNVEARPRTLMLGVGTPVLLAIVGILVQSHAF